MAEFGAFLVRCWVLTRVTRGVRASLDANGRRGESMDMENRIAVLERDVTAIKSDIAVIRRDHEDVSQLKADVSQLKADVSQLKSDVSQLKADVLTVKDEVMLIRVDLARLQGDCATKADIVTLKGWMLGITLTILSLTFGMNAIIFNALQKATAAPKPTHAFQTLQPERPLTAILK